MHKSAKLNRMRRIRDRRKMVKPAPTVFFQVCFHPMTDRPADDEDICGARGDQGYMCTRKPGHDGCHEGGVRDDCVAEWHLDANSNAARAAKYKEMIRKGQVGTTTTVRGKTVYLIADPDRDVGDTFELDDAWVVIVRSHLGSKKPDEVKKDTDNWVEPSITFTPTAPTTAAPGGWSYDTVTNGPIFTITASSSSMSILPDKKSSETIQKMVDTVQEKG